MAWGSGPAGSHLRHQLEPVEAGGNFHTEDHCDIRLFSTVLSSAEKIKYNKMKTLTFTLQCNSDIIICTYLSVENKYLKKRVEEENSVSQNTAGV